MTVNDKNPLLDDDGFVEPVDTFNPLLDDDEDDDGLPDFHFDGVLPSGDVRSPELVDLVYEEDSIFPDVDEGSLSTGFNVVDNPDGHREWEGSSHSDGSVYSRGDDLHSILGNEYVDDDFEDEEQLVDDVEVAVSGFEEDDIDSILAASENDFEGYDLDGADEEVDDLAGFSIDKIIEKAIDVGASDIHLSADAEVAFSVLGDIVRMPEFGLVPPVIVQRAYTKITTHVAQSRFAEDLELDTSYRVKTGKYKDRRLRLSVGRSFSNVFMVFRVISESIPTPKELGVSSVVQGWTSLPNGLVLICGPTGTGKSTTFASLIHKIQLERAQKIITIEKPIEYVYGNVGKAFITQREVGSDARNFSNALTSAMRQAPDIIMVGEVRNREEVDELLRASETGHLALSTMHTNSPAATITRIKSMYEGDEQLRVLGSLKDNVRGIANQVLLKTLDGRSRFAVQSVLNVTDEVSEMIGDGDSNGIEQYMRREGLTIEHELIKAVKFGRCSLNEARSKSASPIFFDSLLDEK